MAAVRTVLFVVRTPAALHRLLDVLPVLSGDVRVQAWFTVDEGSRFSAGLAERLVAAGARLVRWSDALSRSFDLALAASDNGELYRLAAPLILLPHGVGYQRYSSREANAISGLRRSVLVRQGRVVPSTLVLAHPGQLDVLRAVEPRLLPHAAVTGDPCFDRIMVSMRRRDRYRTAFGAAGRRLVVLCSTWGPNSLFGRHPDLPTRTVSELEVDRYRVALVLHPNVWSRHGALQIHIWLRPALEAGLTLVPPEEGWRAAVVAADLVVSDHGSLTCYAAAAGVPTMLAADGGPEVVPGSPIDVLRERLPAMRADQPLADQIDRAIDAGLTVPDTATAIFANHGEAASTLRAAIYRRLRLPPPDRPVRVHPVPVPDLPVDAPAVLAVRSHVDDKTGDSVSLTLQRFPAVTYDEDDPQARHLATNESELDPTWLERAAVVWRDLPQPSEAAARTWAAATLDRWPAARIAITPLRHGGLLARVRGGRVLMAAGTDDAALVGSALHRCLVHGISLDGQLTLDITAGTTTTVRLRPIQH